MGLLFQPMHYYVLRRKVGNDMDIDKLEIISEQFLAIADMWEMLLNAPDDQEKRERSEELLLELLKGKQKELHNSL